MDLELKVYCNKYEQMWTNYSYTKAEGIVSKKGSRITSTNMMLAAVFPSFFGLFPTIQRLLKWWPLGHMWPTSDSWVAQSKISKKKTHA